MRKSVVSFCLLLSVFICYGQNWQFEIGDTWFNTHQYGLKVGDKMPDILLGQVINNTTGKTRFSDFRGKLIILDMWTTSCTSCINAFPEMETLQAKFPNQIQIFTVNAQESLNEITKAFEIRNSIYKKRNEEAGRTVEKYAKLPKLPSIVNAKQLYKLFPTRTVPHHIWIDTAGTVILIGAYLNTNEKKIKEYFQGKTITWLRNGQNKPNFNPNVPYSKIAGIYINPKHYNSFFQGYDNEYTMLGGGSVIGFVDSSSQTTRSTWVNKPVIDLIQYVFADSLKEIWEKTIVSPYNNYILLLVKDSLKYIDDIPGKRLTDEDYVKSKICYEQVVPVSFSEQQRKQGMLQDLLAYYDSAYGLQIGIEQRNLDCYVIVSTSAKDMLSSKSGQWKLERTLRNGRKMFLLQQSTLKSAILNSIENFSEPRKSLRFSIPLLDETEIKNKIDIVLPEHVTSLNELKKVLKPYDIDIVKTKRTIPFLVLKERDY